MSKLLIHTVYFARNLYNNRKIRVWMVMLDQNKWKAIIINPINKTLLENGPIRFNPEAALMGLKSVLESKVNNRHLVK